MFKLFSSLSENILMKHIEQKEHSKGLLQDKWVENPESKGLSTYGLIILLISLVLLLSELYNFTY